MIYNMMEKDKIDLIEYEVKYNKNLPFTPSSPFPFIVKKIQQVQALNQQVEAEPINEESMVVFNAQNADDFENRQSPESKFQQLNLKQINPADRFSQTSQSSVYSKKKLGFFQKIMQKFSKKSNKVNLLVLACDTESKRKQWVFAINYYKNEVIKERKHQNISSVQHQVVSEDTKQSIIGQK